MEEQFQVDAAVGHYKEPTIFESNALYFSVLIGMLVIGGISFGLLRSRKDRSNYFFVFIGGIDGCGNRIADVDLHHQKKCRL